MMHMERELLFDDQWSFSAAACFLEGGEELSASFDNFLVISN